MASEPNTAIWNQIDLKVAEFLGSELDAQMTSASHGRPIKPDTKMAS
jgi:hypothetical protein